MVRVPYDPFKQLSNVRQEMDRFLSGIPNPFEGNRDFGNVRMDVVENDTEVIVACDIPGLEKKDDVSIQVDKHALHISGTVIDRLEMSEGHIHRQERYTGTFQRTVSLPAAVSSEGVTASYKNGVLEVRMPKLESETRRRIDVNFE
ncbi:Hsp20/alpha crystallin family protein [Aciduricibacillus chroicocephali]|uniref:Hsp20/alpha crystallin family protein n=1 Tax=Aciduricibacillus chroicocephali TaxID=3054939 RepID=A0ABY9KVQ2_9BACI|nr:Hsp20/alpha crystallin family protein [Bacillaceae bacterium 44XB]